MAVTRVATGIPGLEDVFDGGIPKDQSYLLLRTAGTGKTLASVQWLLEGEKNGETALFVALAEPFENMQRNVETFGWDISRLELVDLNPVIDDGKAPEEYSIFAPSEVESAPMWQGIYDAVEEVEPDRMAIDSLTQLYYLSTDSYQFWKQLLSLVSLLHQRACTTLMTFEPAELEDEASVALAVDSIIKLRMEVSPHRLTGIRSEEIEKLRGSDFVSGCHAVRITSDGIRVYPHRVERPGDVEEWGADTVLIDSLRGYGLAMQEFGSMSANLHNLLTYLNSRNVTAVLTNELEKITGDLTDMSGVLTGAPYSTEDAREHA